MTTSSTFPRSCARRADLAAASVVWTGRAEGDAGVARQPAAVDAAAARLSELSGRRVSWLRQVHGARVVVVPAGTPDHHRGEEGDAMVTSGATALAVMTADCAPVALASPEGVIGAVHAGWRGLVAGVVQAAVAEMRALGATRVEAALGPCIHAECYAFGAAELARVQTRFGTGVAAELADGRPALDLPAAVSSALDQAGAELVHHVDECTACEADRYFSHRGRGEHERQAMVVWKR